jgi:hypothetical protein
MRKRSKYTPKGASPSAWVIAMQGSCLLSEYDQSIRIDPVREAVSAISKGTANKQNWTVIFDTFNLFEEFSRMPKIMQGANDYVHSFQNVIMGILDRQKATGTKALYPAELDALTGFCELWEGVIRSVTHREYFVAEERTARRLNQLIRQKNGGVRVVEAPA